MLRREFIYRAVKFNRQEMEKGESDIRIKITLRAVLEESLTHESEGALTYTSQR